MIFFGLTSRFAAFLAHPFVEFQITGSLFSVNLNFIEIFQIQVRDCS